MGFWSSAGTISTSIKGTRVFAKRSGSFDLPRVPISNNDSVQHTADALAICSGVHDDDNPSNLAAPSPYTYLVEGNVDRGTNTSSVFASTYITETASSTPPGANNFWTSTSNDSDANKCLVHYLFHAG